jgi:hypothetical protein
MPDELQTDRGHNLVEALGAGRSSAGDHDNSEPVASQYGPNSSDTLAANRIRETASYNTEIVTLRRSSTFLLNYGGGLAATAPATTPLIWSCAARRSTTHFWQDGSPSVPGFSHSTGSGGSTVQLKLFHRDDSPLFRYESHIRPPSNMALFTRSCDAVAHAAKSVSARAKTSLRI